MKREVVSHKEKKESTVKWFIIGIIPIVNLYFAWKAAEMVSGHEKVVPERYETIQHLDKKESTVKWFILGIIPIVNLYVLYKMAVDVSGHEKKFEESSPQSMSNQTPNEPMDQQ